MSAPKVQTVNVVTMEHGRQFAEYWFEGDIDNACSDSGIIKWPNDKKSEDYIDMEKDICVRVFAAVKEQIAETFVRIANAVIEEERTRVDAPLVPPRVETVEVVTLEHAETYIEEVHQRMVDSGDFSGALEQSGVMTWPDDGEGRPETEAQKHFNDMSDEIRDRLHEETKAAVAEAFVRIAGEVTSRERNRR
jgi:hypothetical protein